jgi:hypothetical protein
MNSVAMPAEVEAERLKLELRLALLEAQEHGRGSFIGFCNYVWPEAILSTHHEKMASAFDRKHASSTHKV